MKKLLPLAVLLPFLFCNCATIITKKPDKIQVHTTQPADVFLIKKSLEIPSAAEDAARIAANDGQSILSPVEVDGNLSGFDFRRKIRKRMDIAVFTDSTSGRYRIARRYDRITNLNYFNVGYGFIVDLATDRAYFHPRNDIDMDLGVNRSLPKYFKLETREKYNEKGRLFLSLNLPSLNYIIVSPRTGYNNASAGGFFGIGASADYHYNDNYSVEFSFNVQTNFRGIYKTEIGNIDYSKNEVVAWNIALSNNRHFNRFSLGYGLTILHYKWKNEWWEEVLPDENGRPNILIDGVDSKYWAAGTVFNTYYKCSSAFRVGVIYMPTFYRFHKNTSWRFEQVMSLSFKFDINTGSRIR